MNSLSALNREQIIKLAQEQIFDLVVIGGGITGAGIALDASSRGLKVLLVEKSDFASGTSSKSTKLIHGGLRYLKQLEFKIVRETGQERAIVHRLAPHLVISEKMLLPLVKGGTYSKVATSFGLWVYDFLAGVKGNDRRKMLNKNITLNKEPLLRKDILLGSGLYAEYRTDDARLTIENIKTAAQFGALSLNYVQAEKLHYEENKLTGLKCQDLLSGQVFDVQSQHIISAAGPWVDQIRKMDDSLSGKHLFLSKGVHIVVAHRRFPLQHSVYFDISDGRMIFAIPRGRATYIGTTDTSFNGDLGNIPVSQEDAQYLLDGANDMFPEVQLTLEDIESSWAGLRPLIFEEGKSASQMSRKDEVFLSNTGLISIAGGKLTGYRKMAERVVNIVAKRYKQTNGKDLKPCSTDQIPLAGGALKNRLAVDAYKKEISQKFQDLKLHDQTINYLVANYGKQTDLILEKAVDINTDRPELAIVRAEVWFVIHHELAERALDYFDRRSGKLYFDLPSIMPVIDVVLSDFHSYLNWSNNRLAAEKNAVLKAINQATSFKSTDSLMETSV